MPCVPLALCSRAPPFAVIANQSHDVRGETGTRDQARDERRGDGETCQDDETMRTREDGEKGAHAGRHGQRGRTARLWLGRRRFRAVSAFWSFCPPGILPLLPAGEQWPRKIPQGWYRRSVAPAVAAGDPPVLRARKSRRNSNPRRLAALSCRIAPSIATRSRVSRRGVHWTKHSRRHSICNHAGASQHDQT